MTAAFPETPHGAAPRSSQFWYGAALLFSLLFFGGVARLVGASEAVRRCETEEQEGKPAEERSRFFRLHVVSRHCVWSYLEASDKPLVGLGTVGLFFVTTALAFYTALLWKETKRLGEEATQSAGLARQDNERMHAVMAAQQLAMESQATAAAEQISRMDASILASVRAAAAMEVSIRDAQEATKRELRAYVSLTKCRPAKATPPWPDIYPYHVRLQNSGRTPAYNVQTRVHALIAPYPLTSEDDLPTLIGFESRTIVGAGSRLRADIPSRNLTTLDPATRQQIIAGTMRYYIYGDCSYRDAFGHEHTTRFRFMRPPGQHSMFACAEGNDAD